MAILVKDRRIVAASAPPPELVLQPDDDPAAFAGRLADLAVVAVNFPKYGDGRGYSIARLLRERYGYRGELRAVGEVARDHLHAMAQCGFDAFELRAGEDGQAAISALGNIGAARRAVARAATYR